MAGELLLGVAGDRLLQLALVAPLRHADLDREPRDQRSHSS